MLSRRGGGRCRSETPFVGDLLLERRKRWAEGGTGEGDGVPELTTVGGDDLLLERRKRWEGVGGGFRRHI